MDSDRAKWQSCCCLLPVINMNLPEHGMTISAKYVRFDEQTLWVELSDARVIGAPLAWFPRLLNASAEGRAGWELSPCGIHWEALDEDISVEGLLAGRGDITRQPPSVV